ncbi:hypothetical protein [Aeromicrobium sp. UC242_57]|uniref:hypothetical protein n=1 Tax=Aeromicrobium sp. UC242_57 TaxID=3374624 RepID=UPI00379B045B
MGADEDTQQTSRTGQQDFIDLSRRGKREETKSVNRSSGGQALRRNCRQNVIAFTHVGTLIVARKRIIVGSTGQDDTARTTARRLLDDGHEVVYVGGDQTAEHLLSAAIAEDAELVVVIGDESTAQRLRALCREIGPEAPVVEHSEAPGCDVSNAAETTGAV